MRKEWLNEELNLEERLQFALKRIEHLEQDVQKYKDDVKSERQTSDYFRNGGRMSR